MQEYSLNPASRQKFLMQLIFCYQDFLELIIRYGYESISRTVDNFKSHGFCFVCFYDSCYRYDLCLS